MLMCYESSKAHYSSNLISMSPKITHVQWSKTPYVFPRLARRTKMMTGTKLSIHLDAGKHTKENVLEKSRFTEELPL